MSTFHYHSTQTAIESWTCRLFLINWEIALGFDVIRVSSRLKVFAHMGCEGGNKNYCVWPISVGVASAWKSVILHRLCCPDHQLDKVRFSATVQSHAKRAKVDGVNLNNSNNFVVLDSSTDLSKPISILRQAQTPIVARKTSIVGDDDEVAMELPTRRDSSGNDIVEIQPESPDEEPDDNEDENDEMGEFYMPCE